MRVFSFGGGVQSTAALVLLAEGQIPQADALLFCNVGDDSENRQTLEYVEQVSRPYAKSHGIEFVELHKTIRGKPITLLEEIRKRPGGWVPIPMKGINTGPQARTCTNHFKIQLVARWTKDHGATAEEPAQVGVGISRDEVHRAKTPDSTGFDYTRFWYPLLDLELSRQDCINVVEKAGLPPAPRSACWFCPLNSLMRWRERLQDDPEVFRKAAALEAEINAKRAANGFSEIYLTGKGVPLDQAVYDDGQMDLLDGCESGYCMT